ncbi:hypothetical protein HYS82_01880 [Candidatus Amesbacteria bacterium]|nr:hypothetical protein [Candidatus Amesbacteria bacterium]MBI2587336.1 hypothetical protein [Candidatus Amesbacteria bacterium]
MHHPNFLDRLRLHSNQHYLYPGQLCHPATHVVVGILHQAPESKTLVWKPIDYRQLKKGSILKFLNYASKMPVSRDISRWDSIMEVVTPVSDFLISSGDIVLVSYPDRQFIYPTAPDHPTTPPGHPASP